MTPEKLVERLRQDVGPILKSVVLYGSAAAGDHTGKRSDYNVLVVTERLGRAELKAIAPTAAAWAKGGNPPPLLFTLDRLRKSADAFPIELMDIKECHRILHGDDITVEIAASPGHLRLELEHELKGKLIQLREQYLLTGGKPKAVIEVVIQSLATFLVLFRATLRLFREDVPSRKMDALAALAEHIPFDREVFATVEDAKEGKRKLASREADELFGRYLAAVEAVVDAVDEHVKRG